MYLIELPSREHKKVFVADSNKSTADVLCEFEENGKLAGYHADGVRAFRLCARCTEKTIS